jgi:pyridoxal phosphate enzyme, YggS family
MQTEIINNIKEIRKKIDTACMLENIDPNNLTLIAVSKKKSHDLINIALENGVYDFGENYVQELIEKSKLIKSNKIIWHYIGPIQSNKVKGIAACANWVHTLHREKIITKLDTECKKINKVINACIQVNISSESSKNGCKTNELMDIAKIIKSMKNINLRGIMALPKLTTNKIERAEIMESVKNLSLELQSSYPNATSISLGTSSDFQDAIIHGSTMIRIGESIFGKRL